MKSLSQFNICLTSAKKVTGIGKIFTILERMRADMRLQKLRHLPKVYVMGTTNSGKSALLNSMLYVQSKKKKISKKTATKRSEMTPLTESALPGTTQEMLTIEEFSIGFRVIDTPGIPNINQVISHVSSFKELAKLLPQKEMTCYPLNVKSGYAIWLGALARLDIISGEDKHLTFTVAQDVTIHRTPILKASTVFINQADKLLKPSYFKRSAPPRLLTDEPQEGIDELEE